MRVCNGLALCKIHHAAYESHLRPPPPTRHPPRLMALDRDGGQAPHPELLEPPVPRYGPQRSDRARFCARWPSPSGPSGCTPTTTRRRRALAARRRDAPATPRWPGITLSWPYSCGHPGPHPRFDDADG